MKRQFQRTHIVRYDECNSDGLLTPSAFLRYMQDIAAQDAEDAQLEGNGYWVVKRTVITFTAPVKTHTKLAISTFGIGFTRITAQRGYEAHLITDSTDQHNPHPEQPVISARTLWVYVDQRGRPIRLPARTAEIWLPDGPQAQQTEPPVPDSPSTAPAISTTHVRYSDIDPMQHLNNAATVEMLDNASWEAHRKRGLTPATTHLTPLSYDIEYIESPRFGEQLTIHSWFEPLPVAAHEFSTYQHIIHNEKIVVRAHSRWQANPTNEILNTGL